MDDARSVAAAEIDLRGMMQQAVDQGAAWMPRRRMDDQSGRLVQHDHVVIFVEDIERHRLRRDVDRFRFRQRDGDDFTGCDLEFWLPREAIDEHGSVRDQRLHERSTQFRQAVGHIAVEPFAEILASRPQLDQITAAFIGFGAVELLARVGIDHRAPLPSETAASRRAAPGARLAPPLQTDQRTKPTTPMVIAESATLKLGQGPTAMKSTT
jgi:hypothetical protein